METIELSAAMAAVLKDNANPASLIGLNGADLTKSTMAQISSVVGGLQYLKLSNDKGYEVLILVGSFADSTLTFIQMFFQEFPYETTIIIDAYTQKKVVQSNNYNKVYYKKNENGSIDLFISQRSYSETYIKVIAGNMDFKDTTSNVDISTLTVVPNN